MLNLCKSISFSSSLSYDTIIQILNEKKHNFGLIGPYNLKKIFQADYSMQELLSNSAKTKNEEEYRLILALSGNEVSWK